MNFIVISTKQYVIVYIASIQSLNIVEILYSL